METFVALVLELFVLQSVVSLIDFNISPKDECLKQEFNSCCKPRWQSFVNENNIDITSKCSLNINECVLSDECVWSCDNNKEILEYGEFIGFTDFTHYPSSEYNASTSNFYIGKCGSVYRIGSRRRLPKWTQFNETSADKEVGLLTWLRRQTMKDPKAKLGKELDKYGIDSDAIQQYHDALEFFIAFAGSKSKSKSVKSQSLKTSEYQNALARAALELTKDKGAKFKYKRGQKKKISIKIFTNHEDPIKKIRLAIVGLSTESSAKAYLLQKHGIKAITEFPKSGVGTICGYKSRATKHYVYVCTCGHNVNTPESNRIRKKDWNDMATYAFHAGVSRVTHKRSTRTMGYHAAAGGSVKRVISGLWGENELRKYDWAIIEFEVSDAYTGTPKQYEADDARDKAMSNFVVRFDNSGGINDVKWKYGAKKRADEAMEINGVTLVTYSTQKFEKCFQQTAHGKLVGQPTKIEEDDIYVAGQLKEVYIDGATTAGGMSGSSIFKNDKIVAIHYKNNEATLITQYIAFMFDEFQAGRGGTKKTYRDDKYEAENIIPFGDVNVKHYPDDDIFYNVNMLLVVAFGTLCTFCGCFLCSVSGGFIGYNVGNLFIEKKT